MESAGKDQSNKTEEPTKPDRRKFLSFFSLGILGAINKRVVFDYPFDFA
ncbi:MAG TPA: hypothetical protein VK892_02205 [Pyrinomonadaceae bacterium]|nr:hypothetical protein [Pyrinomonadaceae bacterium]